MLVPGELLAFITLGLKELIMIGLVALALYGRSGSRLIRSTRYGRTIDPWLNLVRVRPRAQPNPRRGQSPAPPPAPPASLWRQGRVFWALALTAAAAVAAWIATRVVVLSGSGTSH